jgi:hypothetical protein
METSNNLNYDNVLKKQYSEKMVRTIYKDFALLGLRLQSYKC